MELLVPHRVVSLPPTDASGIGEIKHRPVHVMVAGNKNYLVTRHFERIGCLQDEFRGDLHLLGMRAMGDVSGKNKVIRSNRRWPFDEASKFLPICVLSLFIVCGPSRSE